MNWLNMWKSSRKKLIEKPPDMCKIIIYCWKWREDGITVQAGHCKTSSDINIWLYEKGPDLKWIQTEQVKHWQIRGLKKVF